jgi:Phage head completion protein (GPL)
MNGLIALPPEPASPAYTNVKGDGFWPNIDLNILRDTLRIGPVVTHHRLEEAVIAAMINAARQLAAWRLMREAEGRTKLADVPAMQIGGASVLVASWRRAVGQLVMADLAETHRDIGATDSGAQRGTEMALTADDHRRNATHAIRDILGVTRTSVELI